MFFEVVLLCFLAPLFYLGYIFWLQKRSDFFRTLDKIPGPKGYPVIGAIMDLLLPQDQLFKMDRKRAIEYYPICKQVILDEALVDLYHPGDVEKILTSVKNISKSSVYDFLHPWLNTGLLTSDGSKWQIRRKILTPAFHFSILQEFVEIFNEGTVKLIEDLNSKDGKVVNVVPVITEYTLQSIAETSMGTKLDASSKRSRDYKNAVYGFGKVVTYRQVRPWLYPALFFWMSPTGKQCKDLVKTLHDFSDTVISDRKKMVGTTYSSRKRLAMLDLLLAAKDKGSNIDDKGIREEVDTFMFEGHDTTSVGLCYVLLLLANHRKTQDEVYNEITEVISKDALPSFSELQELRYTERVLKECLRLYPSVPFIARKIAQDFQSVTGYLVPKGTSVNIHIYDIHRDPRIYPDPEKFDPDRFLPENSQKRHPFAYVPFSAGPRNCIGQRFAMLELKAALCGILRNFVLEPVTKPEDLVFISDMVLRTENGIDIRFIPRK